MARIGSADEYGRENGFERLEVPFLALARLERVDGDATSMYKPDVGRQRYRRLRGLRIDAEDSQ